MSLTGVSAKAIQLRHEESKRIARLPPSDAAPSAALAVHVVEIRALADYLEAAINDNDKIAEAIKTYARWRLVSGNWVYDMDALMKRCAAKGGGTAA